MTKAANEILYQCGSERCPRAAMISTSLITFALACVRTRGGAGMRVDIGWSPYHFKRARAFEFIVKLANSDSGRQNV